MEGDSVYLIRSNPNLILKQWYAVIYLFFLKKEAKNVNGRFVKLLFGRVQRTSHYVTQQRTIFYLFGVIYLFDVIERKKKIRH